MIQNTYDVTCNKLGSRVIVLAFKILVEVIKSVYYKTTYHND